MPWTIVDASFSWIRKGHVGEAVSRENCTFGQTSGTRRKENHAWAARCKLEVFINIDIGGPDGFSIMRDR